MKLTDDRVIEIKHETRTEDRFLGLGEKKVEEYSIELAARERITDPIVMKLTDDRVIEIKHETRTEDRFLGLGEKKVEEYSIELAARERITDPIDLAAIDLYFGPDAKNGDEVRFGSFQNQESVGEYMQSFKDQVLAELERRNLTNLAPDTFRNLTNLAPDTFRYAPAALAALIVFGCIAFAIFTDGVNLPLIILGGALAIAAAVIAERTNVHSPEAVELRR